jgi:hypothetical protein
VNVIVSTCFSDRFDDKGGINNLLYKGWKVNVVWNGRSTYVIEKQLLVEGRNNFALVVRGERIPGKLIPPSNRNIVVSDTRIAFMKRHQYMHLVTTWNTNPLKMQA